MDDYVQYSKLDAEFTLWWYQNSPRPRLPWWRRAIRRLLCWLGIHTEGEATGNARTLCCPHCKRTWSEA